MTKYLLASALALALATPAMAQVVPPNAVQLTLTPATGSIGIGGSLTFNINISNLQGSPDAPQELAGYDLILDFNPAVLTVTGDTLGTNLNIGGQGDSSFVNISSGQIEIFDFSNDVTPGDFSSQAKSFTIGTVTFTGVGAGTSALTFDPNSSFSDQNGFNIVAGYTNASVAVVPEPSSMWLGLIGVPVLVGMALRRRMAA